MDTPTQPSGAQASAPPSRTASSVVGVALLVLALIVLLSGAAVWLGLRILAQNVQLQVEEAKSGKKEVSIKTPLGSLEVHHEVDEARLGLPVYPCAERVRDKDSATVSLDFPGQGNFRIMVAKFETRDSLERVREFYKERLGSEVTKFAAKAADGKTVFEIKRAGQEKVVALESMAAGTRIVLVRTVHGREETN